MHEHVWYVSGCFGVKGSVHPAHTLIEVVDALLLLSTWSIHTHVTVFLSAFSLDRASRSVHHLTLQTTLLCTGKRIAEAIGNPRHSLLRTFVLYLIKLSCMRSQNICFCLPSAAGCLYLQVAAILHYASFPCLNFVCLAGRFWKNLSLLFHHLLSYPHLWCSNTVYSTP